MITTELRRPETRRASFIRPAVIVGSVLLLIAVTAYRAVAASAIKYPGHADPAFYVGVARNIATGSGPTIDYVWQFLVPAKELHHYAFDYWLPLPSVLMSIAWRIDGTTSSAIEVGVAMSVLFAVSTYLLARTLTSLWWVPPIAAVGVVIQPNVSIFAVQADAATYLAVFATLAMAAAIAARRRPLLWIAAGLATGLANLARSEGLLLVIVLVVAACAWHRSGDRRLAVIGLLGGYLAMMSPLIYASFEHFGTPLPPAGTTFPFISDYSQLYAVHVSKSFHNLIPHGPGSFIHLRLNSLGNVGGSFFHSFYSIDAIIVVLLLGIAFGQRRPAVTDDADRTLSASTAPDRTVPDRMVPDRGVLDRGVLVRRALDSPWLVPAGFALVVIVFDTVLTPAVASAGAIDKVMMTLTAPLVIAALIQVNRIRLPAGVLACALVVGLAGPVFSIATVTQDTIDQNDQVGIHVAALKPALDAEKQCLGRTPVLMTILPWETAEATGYPTVQIPDGNLDDILSMVRKYGVTDIVVNRDRRTALKNPGKLSKPGGVLQRTRFSTSDAIYRIAGLTSGTAC